MWGTWLKSPTVTHHRFVGVGVNSSWESLTWWFFSFYTIYREMFSDSGDVDIIEDIHEKFMGVSLCRMKRVTFLPVKFACTKKGARTLFPSYDICPLVVEHWEVFVALELFFEKVTEKCLWCWTQSVVFWEFFSSDMCDRCKFWCESFDMFFFFFKKWDRYEEGKHDISDAESYYFFTHLGTYSIPECDRFWKKSDTPSDRRVFKHFSMMCYIEIPRWVVRTWCGERDFFSHISGLYKKYLQRQELILCTIDFFLCPFLYLFFTLAFTSSFFILVVCLLHQSFLWNVFSLHLDFSSLLVVRTILVRIIHSFSSHLSR